MRILTNIFTKSTGSYRIEIGTGTNKKKTLQRVPSDGKVVVVTID